MCRKTSVGLALVLGLGAACSASTDPSPGARPTFPLVAPLPVEQRLATPSVGTPTAGPAANAASISRIDTAQLPLVVATRQAPVVLAPAGARSFTAAFTGDTLVHSPLWNRAAQNAGGVGFDFRPMLDPLRALLEPVDLAVCHLETPFAPEGEALSTEPRYGVPAEVADALASAGYDRCSTASNHTADRGPAGIDRTVNALEAVEIAQSGMARTPAEIEPRVFEVNGIRISHLSYTFSYNGLSLPVGEEWRSAIIDPDRVIADSTEARRLGAAVVIVSLHWGAEGVAAPTAWQRQIAEKITSAGTVDLIVGHHAHVLQPIEQVNDTWVVFGLGNIISNLPTSASWPASSQDAAVVEVGFTVAADGRVTVGRPLVFPTWVDKTAGWIVRPVLEALADPTTPAGLRGPLNTSLARTERVVGDFIAPH